MRIFLIKLVLTIAGFALYIILMSGASIGLHFLAQLDFLPEKVVTLLADPKNVLLLGCLVGSALFLLLLIANKNTFRRLNQSTDKNLEGPNR